MCWPLWMHVNTKNNIQSGVFIFSKEVYEFYLMQSINISDLMCICTSCLEAHTVNLSMLGYYSFWMILPGS